MGEAKRLELAKRKFELIAWENNERERLLAPMADERRNKWKALRSECAGIGHSMVYKEADSLGRGTVMICATCGMTKIEKDE